MRWVQAVFDLLSKDHFVNPCNPGLIIATVTEFPRYLSDSDFGRLSPAFLHKFSAVTATVITVTAGL